MRVSNLLLAMTLALAFYSLGYASPASGAESPASESTQVNEESAPPSIMDTPLDGSSVEAFKAGLKLVDEQAGEKKYRSVMSALDYLLFYDLSVKHNKQKLYASLDGQSPNQILQAVKDRRTRK